MKKIWSDLPLWAKGTIAVAGVATVIGIGFMIRKAVKKFAEGREEREQEKGIEQGTQQELNQLQNQGVTPTISDLNASTLCNTIQTLLDGCELSGSEKQVVDAISNAVKNQADWIKLQQTWGVRKIDNCGWLTGDTDYDLKTLLTDQLDALDWTFTTYISVLKKRFAEKGITF